MANAWMNQFTFNMNHAMTVLEGQVTIGASGAVSGNQGAGISSVEKLATGIYRINLQGQYYKFLGSDIRCLSGVTGGNVTAGSFNTGTAYQITALGNTNWVTAGIPSTATAAVGDVFVAAAAGSGTGTAKVVTNSGIVVCEVMQDPNPSLADNKAPYIVFQTLSAVSAGTVAAPTFTGSALGTHTHSFTPAGTNANDGPPETFTGTPGTTGATSGGTPAGTNSAPAFTGSAAVLTQAHPTDGSIIRFTLTLRNSSVKGKGES